MIALDEEALICDFAETYQIYDYTGLSPSYAAILSVGLREDSRIKRKMVGIEQVPPNVLLQGLILDNIRQLSWALVNGKGPVPTGITEKMFGTSESVSDKNAVKAFATSAEFEEARRKIIEGRS